MTSPTWNPERWQRATELFDEAIALSPEQRAAFLARLGNDSPDLAPAVERMLLADAAFGADTPSPVIAMVAEVVDPILPSGTRLGAYQIESCLGAGGMGRVYRAHRVADDVAHTVAIKCIRFPGRDWETSRRFLRERKILARLSHPNIARFLDAGADADGQPFVVIEFIDGIPITDFVRQHRLDLPGRIRLLLKVLSAVAYLHGQLIVHRDIKPGNVLVTADGEPYLLDFGIAKPLATSAIAQHADGDTAIDQRAFSLAYAAPEQLRGTAAGTSADIYSLGVLAYEVLSGCTPYAFEGLAFAEAQLLILEHYPEAMSESAPALATLSAHQDHRSWQRALRGDLDRIVLHALKKEPAQRYATVEAMADDLQRHLQCEPISLRGGQGTYRMGRFVRRHRLAVSMAAGLALALIGSSVALWQQNRLVERERDTALAERRHAQSISGLLISAFEAADPSRNRGEKVTAREVLDQAARRANDPGIDPATQSAMLLSISDVYRTLGLRRQSADAAQVAVNLGAAVDELTHSRAWRVLALARLDLDDIEGAEAALSQADKLAPQGDDPALQTELILRELASLDILIARGLAPDALELAEKTYAMARSTLSPSDPLLLECGIVVAERLRTLRMPERSGPIIESLLASIPDPAGSPIGLRLLGLRARHLRDVRQFEPASKAAAKYLSAVEQLYGVEHPSYVSALDLLAKTQRDSGKLEDAISSIRRALQLSLALDRAADPDADESMILLNNLAHTLNMAEQWDEGIVAANRAVEIALRSLPAIHNNTAVLRKTLAQSLIGARRYQEALVQLEHSEAIFSALDKPTSPGVFRAGGEVSRAEALLGLNRHSEALIAFDRGWARLRDLDPASDEYLYGLRVRRMLDNASAK